MTLLSFPTIQYICGISLSYYASSTLDVRVLRVNIRADTLPPLIDSAISQWNYWSEDYDITQVEEDDRDNELRILIEGLEFGGEAEEEEQDGQWVATVDNITLTLCLPCDFDMLSNPGNLVLTAPSSLNVSLGHVTNFTVTASSPLCPSLPLIFNIE